MKIDWKRKLTSRKFWVTVATFVGMFVVYFGGTEETATQITALIMAGAAVIAYIVGEGLTDAANVSSAVEVVEDVEPEALEEEPEDGLEEEYSEEDAYTEDMD